MIKFKKLDWNTEINNADKTEENWCRRGIKVI